MSEHGGVTMHFRGGPLDGHMRQEQEAPPVYRVPAQPRVGFTAADDEPILPKHHLYRRAPGVVASEAVYDYEGLA